MAVIISKTKDPIRARIQLPASKSISNRALLIRAMCTPPFQIHNLSEAEDTRVLLKSLQELSKGKIDVGDSGTACRFLTAFFSILPGKRIITGSGRMKQRPVLPLVNALKQIGAKISFCRQPGFLPLHIEGKELEGGEVHIHASVSSQFISAMLLIAPLLKKGIRIKLLGKPVSYSYIEMTLSIMSFFGAEITLHPDIIEVKPTGYKPREIYIENDWSAAAFWYEIVALNERSEVELSGVMENSVQGDSIIRKIMPFFGVSSHFSKQGLFIEKKQLIRKEDFVFDFTKHPDLAQPLAVTCAVLGKTAILSGLDTLRWKETDRISALTNELRKINCQAANKGNALVLTPGNGQHNQSAPFFNTYNDHRMLMSLLPVASRYPHIKVEDIHSVRKSYPLFINEFQKAGFGVKHLEA